MGFFTKDAPTPAGGLAPLSKDRIKQAIERAAGWPHHVYPDGTIGASWKYGRFEFSVYGDNQELLCVRGVWRGKLEEADYARALEVANERNREKLWPKAFVERDDEGMVRVYTEHNVNYEHGLSDEQLWEHLLCMVNASMVFFESVSEVFPEAREKYKPGA